MNVDEVLRKAETKEVFLVESGWLTEHNPAQLREVYSEFEREFEKVLPVFVERMGPPDFSEASAPDLRDALYFEALRLVGWKHGVGYVLLAFGQHDQETPVFVSVCYREL